MTLNHYSITIRTADSRYQTYENAYNVQDAVREAMRRWHQLTGTGADAITSVEVTKNN